MRMLASTGESSLLNAALVCSLHHRHVHELGYTVELGRISDLDFEIHRAGW